MIYHGIYMNIFFAIQLTAPHSHMSICVCFYEIMQPEIANGHRRPIVCMFVNYVFHFHNILFHSWVMLAMKLFLHGRSWISPWIKWISNELDIIIHVIASQLSCYCGVISNWLWRHQQNEDRASKTRGQCVKIGVCIVIYGFVMSCKKWNNVCILVTNCLCAHSSVIFVFIWYTQQ